MYITGSGPGKVSPGAQFGKYLFFQSPAWDYRSFDVDRDVKFIDDAVGQRLNAIDSNLKRRRKLILFQGWSDAAVPPTGTIAITKAWPRRWAARTPRVSLASTWPGSPRYDPHSAARRVSAYAQLINFKYWLARIPFLWRNTDIYLEITRIPSPNVSSPPLSS